MQAIADQPVPTTSAATDSFGTLLVHAEPGAASTHRIQVAARLARTLDARMIGLGAETFDPAPAGAPMVGYVGGDWMALIAKNLKAAEEAFRRDAAGADVEWRQIQDYPHRALCRTSGAADLIVLSPKSRQGSLQSADPADVAMAAGRPILLVPEARDHLRGDVVLIAWKNTRECRRAVADARPLLRRAEEVVVLAVCPKGDEERAGAELNDVVANLKRHGITARARVAATGDLDVGPELEQAAMSAGADLIVAGAYGHSRLREWAFGGVTDALLHRPGCFVLMSH